jgi:hypothetical protein
MDYAAAEQEFRRLEGLRQAGQIDMDRYREQLDKLRIVDGDGRTWMLQETTGQWFVQERGQWQAAAPPEQVASPSSAPPDAAASTPSSIPTAAPAVSPTAKRVPAHRVTARQAKRRRPGCVGIFLRLLLWALFWAAAAWALDSLVRAAPLWAFPALGLGALATLVLWVRWMTRFGRAARKGAQGGVP